MRIVCISDTHSLHNLMGAIPDGDLLIHAGDGLGAGTLADVKRLNSWLGTLPHTHKVVIAGNHDACFEHDPELARELITNAIYLQDSGTEIRGFKIWGSPWTPAFNDWSFNLQRGEALARIWQQIPDDTDILITHGPPQGIMDEVMDTGLSISGHRPRSEHAGCADLWPAIRRVRPRLHVFGHIHEGYGEESREGTRFINASTCTENYRPTNPPIVVDL